MSPYQVEAYGVKGFRSKPWRRTFRSVDALNAWAARHDAEVIGTREVTREEAQASRPDDQDDEPVRICRDCGRRIDTGDCQCPDEDEAYEDNH